jgi:galactose-1-phosphate uridylyltransferase
MRKDFLGRHITIIDKSMFQKTKDNPSCKHKEDDCFFCDTEEKKQKELARISAGEGWHIRVVEGAVIKEAVGENEKSFEGHIEYIIETPHHFQKTHNLSYQELKVLFKLIKDRHKEVSKKFEKGTVLISKDVTEGKHGVFQIFGMNIKPNDYKLKTRHSYHADCSFCKLVETELDSDRKIYENTVFTALSSYAPTTDGEVMIVSKKHLRNLSDFEEMDITALAEILKKILETVSQTYSSYSIYINSGFEDDDFHFHIEILPKNTRYKKVKISQDMGLKYIYKSPEEAALNYRENL